MQISEEDARAIVAGVNALSRVAYQMCKERGWHNNGATFGDRIALAHSELSEALEEWRRDMPFGIRFEDSPETPGVRKPEGVVVEFADVLIRLADNAEHYKLNLGEAVMFKLDYNNKRPFKHGGKRI